ncbi:MAG: hypothetical protein IJH84_19545 [Saccharopolyspora sp.]|uniref:hypothetical protein n=1 Tax=Saccharopolyspora sp. TaxID=33915 RepID=UPI0025D434DD|nr:hypothetical protein [Saccharopolyspora sp.]MBQ6643210.1 hypothetical protein [Saccharopolyspora sp.]
MSRAGTNRAEWIGRTAEIAVPGALIGVLAGGFAGPLAAMAQQPPMWTVVTTLALMLPLGVLGGGHGVLLVTGLARPGMFAPVALYWLAGFPLARLVHEVATRWVLGGSPGLPEAPLGFLLYQALLGTGFAIGFLWLHERLAPHWFLRIAARNELARSLLQQYVQQVERVRQR